VLEAMACGVPVVSAAAPSARALLVDGTTGLLCPARDVGAYAEAVMRLIGAPGGRQSMGAEARGASAAYSWDAASESVASVYRSMVMIGDRPSAG
jgi:glycosyltransferase involved in cell wall biosynthesis